MIMMELTAFTLRLCPALIKVHQGFLAEPAWWRELCILEAFTCSCIVMTLYAEGAAMHAGPWPGPRGFEHFEGIWT